MINKLIVVISILCCCIAFNSVKVSAILNGDLAPTTPYHAFVRSHDEIGLQLEGGGTLISDQHILTAGQLISGYVRWTVGMGHNFFLQLSVIESVNATLHPEYSIATRDNNIGIIRLPNTIQLTANIQPIALPPLFPIYPSENEQGIITGFGLSSYPGGRSDILLRAFPRVISNTRCAIELNVQTPNHFCAEDIQFGSNICNGDVGGSFTVQVHRRELLIGISSINVEACNNNIPSAFIRISHYRQWIQYEAGV